MKTFPAFFFIPLSILISAVLPSHAEDPVLGTVKGIQCLNCVKDSVSLVLFDPFENRNREIRVANRDYNRILTPLTGKQLHIKATGCFYWLVNEESKDMDSLKAAPDTDTLPEAKEGPCIPFSSPG